MKQSYDIVILGSGIASTTLALALGQIGCRTLVIEKDQHPRFAIGESTIPSSTVAWSHLARTYNIPEYHHISHYLGMQEKGITGYPKAGFWFGLHKAGQPLQQRHELMLETLKLPVGPDVHMYREEVDHYLVKRLPFYGVDYSDHTAMRDYEYDSTRQLAHLTLDQNGTSHKVTARFVVDATGHAAVMVRKFDLLKEPHKLHTHTRGIFGHFRDVKFLENLYPYNDAFRLSRDGTTQHHCFEGGWMWIIRFDNGISSVGLMLDPRIHPVDESLSPEEELHQFVAQFPDVYPQLKDMKPVRPVARSGRIQFQAKTILGDGFILTPHAAGFIDPIFSNGLGMTAAFTARLIPYIQQAMRENDFSTKRFRPIEKTFFREFKHIDLMASAAIESFRDYDVMKQFLRYWASSNMVHFLTMIFGKIQDPESANLLFGSGSQVWRDMLDELHATLFDPTIDNATAATKMKEINDRRPLAFDVINSQIGSDRACLFTLTRPNMGFIRFCHELFNDIPEVKADRDLGRFTEFVARTQVEGVKMRAQYTLGKWTNSQMTQHIDRIHALTNSPNYPGNKDFFAPFSDFWNGRFLKKG